MRKVEFPQIKNFSDCFESFSFEKENAPQSHPWEFEDYNLATGKKSIETIDIGGYCSIHPFKGEYRSLYVRASEWLVCFIKQNMIPAGVNDRINFEIIPYTDGTALVVARNNAIIGSRWIAMIDSKTIPARS